MILQGKYAFHLDEITKSTPFLRGNITPIDEIAPQSNDKEFSVLANSLRDITVNMLEKLGNRMNELSFAIKNIDNNVQLVNFLCVNSPLEPNVKQRLLSTLSIKERAYNLFSYLNREAQLVAIRADIFAYLAIQIGTFRLFYHRCRVDMWQGR